MTRKLLAPFLSTLIMATTAIGADEPVVFISAFAGGEKAAIHAFQFDTASGVLKPLHRTTDVHNPFFLALSPDQRFLYAIDTDKFGGSAEEFVAAYAIEGRTGQLRRLNRQSARGKAPCYLEVDATGKTVMVASFTSGTVAALPVGSDGSLGEAASVVQHAKAGPDPAHPKTPNAHCIVASPDQRFALSADLGTDQIIIYRLDAAAARLTPHGEPVTMAPGTGPRHLVFDPSGRRVYVIAEHNNTVTFFDYAADAGTLAERQTISTLPAEFTGKSYCADLKITPDGRFLYGTNRGHDSIAAYRIAEDGRLTSMGFQPSLGQGPQNLLITPDGRWLLCANMPGNSVVVFQIDAATGNLKAVGEPVAMPMPSCIRLLP